jgi:hypothetical protein
MMRCCFDFQSFGVSIRFMVAHEAPHFLCARCTTTKKPLVNAAELAEIFEGVQATGERAIHPAES